jgi:1-acyl-sn-glycerol-3-phosphate acyltransferase
MRYALAPLRAVLLVLHILLGLAIVFAVFPLCSQARRNRINHWWSGIVVRACGARLRVSGQPLTEGLRCTGIAPGSNGRLLLSNHVSWIDIFAINAAMPCRFVAKAEIGRWPIIGSLVTRSGTLYIERGRRRAVAATNDTVQAHLRAGESIVVFPEGTTTRGDRLLPFHSNLIAPALEVDCPAWPVGLRYTERGAFSDAAAFIGEMGLVTSLAKVLVADRLEIEVAFLAPLDAAAHENRHTIARAAHAALSAHFGWLEVPERAEIDENGTSNDN